MKTPITNKLDLGSYYDAKVAALKSANGYSPMEPVIMVDSRTGVCVFGSAHDIGYHEIVLERCEGLSPLSTVELEKTQSAQPIQQAYIQKITELMEHSNGEYELI